MKKKKSISRAGSTVNTAKVIIISGASISIKRRSNVSIQTAMPPIFFCKFNLKKNNDFTCYFALVAI